MSLLRNALPLEKSTFPQESSISARTSAPLPRRQSQHSVIAKSAIMSQFATKPESASRPSEHDNFSPTASRPSEGSLTPFNFPIDSNHRQALSDTPATTPGTSAPNSPKISVLRKDSGTLTPRTRPTTLDIPGLTKSKVSPDGRIAQRDVGSKLVIIMVGLPARGKSYITKKICRYLNWLQHDTKIFNVGERRRTFAAGAPSRGPSTRPPSNGSIPNLSGTYNGVHPASLDGILKEHQDNHPLTAARLLLNGNLIDADDVGGMLPQSALDSNLSAENALPASTGGQSEDHGADGKVPFPREALEQNADFFDPENEKGAKIRDQVALETLDDLLDFILDQNGSVGIFDATNSTLDRRQKIMKHIRDRAGPELNVLFVESLCLDTKILEANMRLKLSGPDYRDQDPVVALADFRKRVELYQKAYVPLGEYEESNGMSYLQMIDVGRKFVSYQTNGFLSAQTVYYLLNFNLSPRQIWITRHGESLDNINGKIGGDSELTPKGHDFAKALAGFIKHERAAWDTHQEDKARHTHFPPLPGDTTPPNPEYSDASMSSKSFCVWTSMMKRSIETAQYFDEDEFDVKQFRMLNELHAGSMEGMTYEEIKIQYHDEYERRKEDKLHYRYPGTGGEGYLDIINRLRAIIVEMERMTDHVLLIGHRSVARVLLAYFKGLNRDDVADLDVPLGMLYMLEPKPYGVDFKAYRFDEEKKWFEYIPDYKLRPSENHYS